MSGANPYHHNLRIKLIGNQKLENKLEGGMQQLGQLSEKQGLNISRCWLELENQIEKVFKTFRCLSKP